MAAAKRRRRKPKPIVLNLDAAKEWLEDQAVGAEERKDQAAAAGYTLGSQLLQSLRESGAADMIAKKAQSWAQGVILDLLMPKPKPAPAAPQKPAAVDPFTVLGLDRATATAEDVRRVQRELAKIYHGDAAGAGVASAKMVEINTAAAAALKVLGR